jgi:hypothetical protein
MKPALALLLAALALSACATRPPADVAHVSLAPADSPIVRVTKLWLERTDGRLLVAGYAVRQIDAKDTTGTHLDVTLFAQDGRKLRESVEHFEPRQIPRRPRMPDSVTFRLPLDPLPAGTVRVEVRAHEGTH